MVKIKQKKQLNLPQLIEWAMLPYTDVSCEKYETENMTVTFGELGNPHIESKWHYLPLDESFTVTIEEEITEDTVIPILVTKNIIGDYNEWKDRSIKDFVLAHMEAIYIPNDDLTLTLIWTKEKGL